MTSKPKPPPVATNVSSWMSVSRDRANRSTDSRRWLQCFSTAILTSQLTIGSLFAAEEGLLLYYPCDEGSGTVLKDHGPFKKDGKLNAEPNGEAKGVTIVCEKAGEWVAILTSDGVQRKNITKGSDSALAEGERPIVLDRDKDYAIDYEGGRIKALEGGRVEPSKPFTLDFRYSNPGPRWVEGRIGKGLKLDGVDDFVRLAELSNEAVPSHITIECWINLNSDCSDSAKLFWDGSRANAWGLRMESGSLSFYGKGHFNSKASLGIHPTRGEWHHIVLTLKEDQVVIYRGGQEFMRRSLGERIQQVGIYQAGGHRDPEFLAAIIDEIKIYSRVKSAEEIAKDAAQ